MRQSIEINIKHHLWYYKQKQLKLYLDAWHIQDKSLWASTIRNHQNNFRLLKCIWIFFVCLFVLYVLIVHYSPYKSRSTFLFSEQNIYKNILSLHERRMICNPTPPFLLIWNLSARILPKNKLFLNFVTFSWVSRNKKEHYNTTSNYPKYYIFLRILSAY